MELWPIIAILVAALLVVFLWGLFISKKRKMDPISKWQTLGGIVGMLIGIGLAELGVWEYPVAFIAWMLGMAAGAVFGKFCVKK